MPDKKSVDYKDMITYIETCRPSLLPEHYFRLAEDAIDKSSDKFIIEKLTKHESILNTKGEYASPSILMLYIYDHFKNLEI